MIYIQIIVLIIVACAFYELGLSNGRKENNGICQDCLDDVFMQGYDAGIDDQASLEHLGQILSDGKTAVAIGKIKKAINKKKVAKKTVKKATKKATKKVAKKKVAKKSN